jgi:CBS domain-containing protein
MTPERLKAEIQRECPLLREDEPIAGAVRRVLDSGQPALPVVDGDGRFRGIFGEREFMAALLPGYVGELRSARFVRGTLDDALEKRAACRAEPVSKHMTTDRVSVGEGASDVQVGEAFLHHRVLIVPVVDDRGRVVGLITRADFFRGLAERFLAQGS